MPLSYRGSKRVILPHSFRIMWHHRREISLVRIEIFFAYSKVGFIKFWKKISLELESALKLTSKLVLDEFGRGC